MANLYSVLSEALEGDSRYPSLEPPEPYRICELICAESPSQAMRIAWKHDMDIVGIPYPLPKLDCKLVLANSKWPKGIVANPGLEIQKLWSKVLETQKP